MAKVLATFRLEEDDWQAFHNWAKSRESTATRELTRFVLGSIGKLDEKIDTLDSLDSKLDEKIDSKLQEKFKEAQDAIAGLVTKIESLEERIKPIEGMMTEKKSESLGSPNDESLGLTDTQLAVLLMVTKQAVNHGGLDRESLQENILAFSLIGRSEMENGLSGLIP